MTAGADVVVATAPVWDDAAVRGFFTTSTRNLLAAERDAGIGIGHQLALTIVGADRPETRATIDQGILRAQGR